MQTDTKRKTFLSFAFLGLALQGILESRGVTDLLESYHVPEFVIRYVGIGVFGIFMYRFAATHKDENELLLAQVNKKHINEERARRLLPFQTLGTHLSNVDSSDAEQVEIWRRDVRKWERATYDAMNEMGCTPEEISAFWDMTDGDLAHMPRLHSDPIISAIKQMLQRRLEKLRKIIAGYSGNPILMS